MKLSRRHVLAGVAATMAFSAIPVTAATVDWFLKLDKIQGESTDDRHKGEIEVMSWSWGVSQATSAGPGGGPRASKPCVADFAFTKLIDKSTPQLIGNAATGLHIANGILIGRKAGKEQQEFLKIELKDVLVSSFQTGGSGGGVPAETISLSFASVTVEYKTQNPDGSLGTAVSTTVAGGGC
jgi:type VI secretion system secreted protein Hcp